MKFSHLLLVASVLITAGCGGTPSYGSTSGGNNSAAQGSSAFTVATANVSGLGTVLVNGTNQTLYILSSEQGGKVTCVAANGCSQVWPPVTLPSGTSQAIAGTGIQASMLGTAAPPDGSVYITYNKWPLYTFTGDSGAMQSHGQGISSFGGTWTAIGSDGMPATAASSSAASSSASSAGGYSGGYYP